MIEESPQSTAPDQNESRDDQPARVAGSKGLSRLIAVVALSVLAVYAVRLTGRGLELQRATLSEQRLGAEVGMLEAEVVALETAAAGAGNDAFTERWAREERGWIQEGDQPLLLVEATPTPPSLEPDGAADADEGFFGRLRRWLSAPDSAPDEGSQ